MPNLFIDTCTSYQQYSQAYYKKMKYYGVKSNFIKVSEGTTWVAKNWTTSLNNSESVGVVACVYHFFHGSTTTQANAEADFFAKQLNNARVDKRIKYMVDAEVSGNNTTSVLAFIARMRAHGYVNACVYASRDYWLHKLDSSKLPMPWVAGYGVSNLGINNAKAWQYDNKFKGYSQDINKDLTSNNWFTTAPETVKTTTTPKKESANVSLDEALKVIAQQVIKGTFGNGEERKNNIYNAVQRKVNTLVK